MLSTFGRIGRDAELRFTPSGVAVANIALSYNYGRKGQDGNRPTQWLEIAVWGKQAEALTPHLLKGKQVYVAVKDIHVDSFVKQDGTTASKLVGDLVDIKFASDGSGSQNTNQDTQSRPAQSQGQQQRPQQQSSQQSYDDFDDSIPF